MDLRISEIYGKGIITTSGKKLGRVEDLIIDFEDGAVSSILLKNMDNISRSEDLHEEIRKNSINYKRVKNVSEVIVVGNEPL
jgi:PRC-barrel domain.